MGQCHISLQRVYKTIPTEDEHDPIVRSGNPPRGPPFAAFSGKLPDIPLLRRGRSQRRSSNSLIRAVIDKMSGPYFEVKESGNIAVQLILGDAIARRALLAFMVSEHAEENVLFFEANLALASSRAFEADFKDIVDRFVRADTAMELNISQELKRRILQAQEECAEAADCSQLLHLAQKEVVQLMAGAFARFQQSKYFQEWREAEDAEFEAESLAADGKTEVLVVGDSLAVAKIISRALVTQGYAVDCAVDKDQALAKMSAKQYGAVLFDMEQLGGLTFVSAYRDSEPALRGRDQEKEEGDQQRQVIIGMGVMSSSGGGEATHLLDGFLRKPFKVTAFDEALHKAELVRSIALNILISEEEKLLFVDSFLNGDITDPGS